MEEKIIGPRTSHEEFFTKHLKLDRPEFAGIAEAVAAGDIAKADKIFADAMRANPKCPKLKDAWIEETNRCSEKQKEGLINRAYDVMDYKFISCGIPWHFADHKIDWEFNPTYNGYKEWPWQLSRHPEWTMLAKYYLLTGDDFSAFKMAKIIAQWLSKAAAMPHRAPRSTAVVSRPMQAYTATMTAQSTGSVKNMGICPRKAE